jgi:hypothetical protein
MHDGDTPARPIIDYDTLLGRTKGLYEAVSRIPNMESSASAAEMRGLLSEYVGGHYLRGDAV